MVRPRQYYTKKRVEARERGAHPDVLFHFTGRTKTLKILEDGFLRGHPQLSLTENPAFGVPGPVVFVVDPGCAIRKGFELWPHVWQRGAEEEAEWIVVPRGTEYEFELPEAVKLPLECVTYIGLIGWVGAEREAIREAAEALGIRAGQFDWEEWWTNGPKMAGSADDPIMEKIRDVVDYVLKQGLEGATCQEVADWVGGALQDRYGFVEYPPHATMFAPTSGHYWVAVDDYVIDLWTDEGPLRDWVKRYDSPEVQKDTDLQWPGKHEGIRPSDVNNLYDYETITQFYYDLARSGGSMCGTDATKTSLSKSRKRLSREEMGPFWFDAEAFIHIGRIEDCQEWILEPRYPVKKFLHEGSSVEMGSWKNWWESEREGERQEYLDQLESAWLRDPLQVGPVIVAELPNGTVDVGDGWHRIAISILHGMKTIPAVVGKKCRARQGRGASRRY